MAAIIVALSYGDETRLVAVLVYKELIPEDYEYLISTEHASSAVRLLA